MGFDRENDDGCLALSRAFVLLPWIVSTQTWRAILKNRQADGTLLACNESSTCSCVKYQWFAQSWKGTGCRASRSDDDDLSCAVFHSCEKIWTRLIYVWWIAFVLFRCRRQTVPIVLFLIVSVRHLVNYSLESTKWDMLSKFFPQRWLEQNPVNGQLRLESLGETFNQDSFQGCLIVTWQHGATCPEASVRTTWK